MSYPLQRREDKTLDHIRAFGLALWTPHYPQAVVGDVWKHKPDEALTKGVVGAVIVWQVNVFATPHDLHVADTRYRLHNDYPEGDENARYRAKRQARAYEEEMGHVTYHGAFIAEREDGTLFLLSTMEDVERRLEK